jgi:hypothetical protein
MHHKINHHTVMYDYEFEEDLDKLRIHLKHKRILRCILKWSADLALISCILILLTFIMIRTTS